MARDYSKKSPSSRSADRGGFHAFKLVFLAFLVGYLTATLFSLEYLVDVINKQWLAYNHKQSATDNKSKVQQAKVELPKPKFEFYTLLAKEQKPESEVIEVKAAPVRPSLPKVIEAKPAAIQPVLAKNNYVIQIASFKTRQDAERLKASLTLKGFDVRVTDVAHDNQRWYRVFTGPYPDRIKAEKAQTQLARSERVMGIIRQLQG